ncbi:hypothetical protein B0O80DRAFT_409012 [Mortierella sp. GBAus27b]|nr:hypothetical protein BGX31_000647 [Mortierella sp. GBA43]KAI8363771.1 hypothetical protein B0O80DRAFT_409012 [Mortierella sp. GBAus27b]
MPRTRSNPKNAIALDAQAPSSRILCTSRPKRLAPPDKTSTLFDFLSHWFTDKANHDSYDGLPTIKRKNQRTQRTQRRHSERLKRSDVCRMLAKDYTALTRIRVDTNQVKSGIETVTRRFTAAMKAHASSKDPLLEHNRYYELLETCRDDIDISLPKSISQPESESISQPESESISQPEFESISQDESESMAQSESEAESESMSQSESEAESESMSQPESEAESESVSQPESEAESESISQPESEAESESMSQPESEAESESMSQPESEAESESIPPPESISLPNPAPPHASKALSTSSAQSHPPEETTLNDQGTAVSMDFGGEPDFYHVLEQLMHQSTEVIGVMTGILNFRERERTKRHLQEQKTRRLELRLKHKYGPKKQ